MVRTKALERMPPITIRPIESRDRAVYKAWLVDPRLALWHFNNADVDREIERVLRSKYNFVVESDERSIGHVAIEGNWDEETSAEMGS